MAVAHPAKVGNAVSKELPWSPVQFRLDYVRYELQANGFRVTDPDLFERVIIEVAYALWPPVHEDVQPSYGAIITDLWNERYLAIPETYQGESIHCDNDHKGRVFADGVGSFFVCESRQYHLWVPKLKSFSDEASLFSLRDEVLFKSRNKVGHAKPPGTDFVIVQRTHDGIVMVMHWDGIISMRHSAWSSRTYQYSLRAEETLATRDESVSEAMESTLRSVLSICLHVLSPKRCGATIVTAFKDDSMLMTCLSSHNSLESPVELTVRKKSHHGPIAHVLGQRDGAALIGESGVLMSVGHWLTAHEEDLRQTPSLGGCRQLTASETSKRIRSPIITVSSDGPVRVFHRGEVIATTDPEHMRLP